MAGSKLGEIKVDLKLNTEIIISELKAVQREAKKATKAIKELSTFLDDNEELIPSILSAFSNNDLLNALKERDIEIEIKN